MSYGTVQAEKMTTESGYSLGAGNASSFKNRFINGAQSIDQRNAGASTTPSGTATYNYLTDRWAYNPTQASKMTWGQNLNSVTPPAGFTYYLGGQVGASANVTVGSGDYFFVRQAIEGYNMADLAFGTASAKSITLSFWVRSSLTGTFGGTIENASLNRGYPFTYTINSANTWEQKTVTFAGDTTGTWGTGNATGFDVRFGLGAGSSFEGTAGSWQSINTVSATGAVDLITTNSATWYITGVQLEVGTVATSFDFRSYGTELALCQRYAYIIKGLGGYSCMSSSLFVNATTNLRAFITFPVTMRSTPTATYTAANTFLPQQAGGINLVPTNVSTSANGCTPNFFSLEFAVSGATVASSGILYDNNTSSAQITLSAEL